MPTIMPRWLRRQHAWRYESCESCERRDASTIVQVHRRCYAVCDACADWGLRPALVGAR